mmetsp:Transcript_40188/g.65134  ORF Transcript_40188/g.65134 Transcript_40188/m.65134 type:complete len:269 (-) Transcript_40188:291-1097(-)
MCIILFSYQSHPSYKLVLLSNRDEFFERPTSPAHFWKEDGFSYLYAGRDLLRGGTWLGITTEGRLAAITNVRVPTEIIRTDAESRGALTTDFLTGTQSCMEYATEILSTAHRYNDFNLLLGDLVRNELICLHSSCGRSYIETIAPGVHGLSNAHLNCMWPKVSLGTTLLSETTVSCPAEEPEIEQLMSILGNTEMCDECLLPETGVPVEDEKKLSPIFVNWPEVRYGTRSCAVILVDHSGVVTFTERYMVDVDQWKTQAQTFQLPQLS